MVIETKTILNKEIEEFLHKQGVLKVGFATLETLAGGPPSTNLTYVLPEAKSAISFALPFDKKKIQDYLAKKDFASHEKDRYELNVKGAKVAKELTLWLQERGFIATYKYPNNQYRREVSGWQFKMPPPISHRYIAVRSGVASFGWSGNVGLKGYGAHILLNTVVTNAELDPTDPIPAEDSFCTKCKLCVKACTSKLIHDTEETSVTIGGKTFTYAKRRAYTRCQYVCGGFTGLNTTGSKHWSTWSPGRFEVPDKDRQILTTWFHAMEKYKQWPQRTDYGIEGYENVALPGYKLHLTCGLCQNICSGDPKETAENYKLLINSGCVIQKPNGDILTLPSEEADKLFNSFPIEHKKLYTEKKNL
jgi:epoxyqueuosine reductase